MENQLQEREPREGERVYYPVYTCWPWPTNRSGGYLWGTLFVLIGGVWLLDNLDLISVRVLDVLWPLVFIGLGVVFLASTVTNRRN